MMVAAREGTLSGWGRTAPADAGSSATPCGPGEGVREGRLPKADAQVCRYRHGLRNCLAPKGEQDGTESGVGRTRPHCGLIVVFASAALPVADDLRLASHTAYVVGASTPRLYRARRSMPIRSAERIGFGAR